MGSAAWILAPVGTFKSRSAAAPSCWARSSKRSCVPADSRLLLLWGAANRDPEQHDAGEFRLDRSGAKGHMAFGKGAHFCVGAALARLEARIALRMLLEQTTWIEAVDVGRWLPSILVRRLERLQLALT